MSTFSKSCNKYSPGLYYHEVGGNRGRGVKNTVTSQHLTHVFGADGVEVFNLIN